MVGPKTLDVNDIVNQIEQEESYREWNDDRNEDDQWDEDTEDMPDGWDDEVTDSYDQILQDLPAEYPEAPPLEWEGIDWFGERSNEPLPFQGVVMSQQPPSLEEILKQIRLWQSEVRNPRNDGWVSSGYADKLRKVRDELNRWHHELIKEANRKREEAISTDME